MRILSVDTSTMMSSISILENDTIVADFNLNQEQTHSEILVKMIERMLNDLKIKLSDIDLFSVAKGPGSFTGLRIGMTTIKAMAQALDKDIIGVSTLEAMAFSILNANKILAIIDARGDRYFAGLFEWQNGKLIKIFEELINERELIEVVSQSKSLTIVGDAIKKLPNQVKQNKNVTLTPANLNTGIAKNICVISKQKYERGEIDDYFDLSPSYLRKSQAEINLKKMEDKDVK